MLTLFKYFTTWGLNDWGRDCSSLLCWILQLCLQTSLWTRVLRKAIYLAWKLSYQNIGFTQTKEQKLASEDKQLFPPSKISLVYTTRYRWNHAISSINPQLAVKEKGEAFLTKSYLIHVYCLFSLFRLLRKCLDGTQKKQISGFSLPTPILSLICPQTRCTDRLLCKGSSCSGSGSTPWYISRSYFVPNLWPIPNFRSEAVLPKPNNPAALWKCSHLYYLHKQANFLQSPKFMLKD